MKYRVFVREVWVQPVIVLAANEDDAMRLVRQGHGVVDGDNLEYSHTLPSETWTAEPEEAEQ